MDNQRSRFQPVMFRSLPKTLRQCRRTVPNLHCREQSNQGQTRQSTLYSLVHHLLCQRSKSLVLNMIFRDIRFPNRRITSFSIYSIETEQKESALPNNQNK